MLKYQLDQMIYYNVSMSEIIDDIIKNKNNIDHLNFSIEIKGKEKWNIYRIKRFERKDRKTIFIQNLGAEKGSEPFSNFHFTK